MLKVNLSKVPKVKWKSPKGRFALAYQDVSTVLQAQKSRGAKKNKERPPFEVEFTELPPGARNYPYHSHSAETEFYIVVSGTGQVRHPRGIAKIKAGDCFVFPPEEPHQIINNSRRPLRYWVIANNAGTDNCFYPDSNKWGIPSLKHYFRVNPTTYYDGEE